MVLTAAHVLMDAVEVAVRASGENEYRRARLDPRFVGDPDGPRPDLALIEIDDTSLDLSPMPLARLDRSRGESYLECHAYGYPGFAKFPDKRRELVHAVGILPVLSGLHGGTLKILVRDTPRELLTEGSQWSGISGGPVTSGGRLLGVVIQHAPKEGPSTITAAPLTAIEFDPANSDWGEGVGNADAWWSRLGARGSTDLTALPGDGRHPVPGLPDFVPTQVRDRKGERSALRATVIESATVLSELRGPAGIGKTALAAELARDHFPGPAAFLTATGYTGVTVTTVLDALAGMVRDDTKRERLLAQLRAPEADPLTRLDDVLFTLAADPVLLVVDNAEDLLTSKGDLRDGGLAAIFTEIAQSRGHGVRILFVTASRVGTRTTARIRLLDAEPVRLDGDMPAEDYDRFVTDLVDARRGRAATLSVSELDRLTGRHPRRTEMLVGVSPGPKLRDADARRLTDIVLESLSPQQARVVEALAVCGRPVEAAAVAQLANLGPDETRAALDELANRRIARQQLERFHLPNSEILDVIRGVTRRLGSDAVAGQQKRAAAYFEEEARRRRPIRLDECVDWFNAIDLYLTGGDAKRALDVIQDVDDSYLRDWGHSDALLPWLRDPSILPTDIAEQVRHTSLLARAMAQAGWLDDAIAMVSDAGRLNYELSDTPRQLALLVQLAGYRFGAGQIDLAVRAYREATRQLVPRPDPDIAEALAGLALCATQTGDFDAALRHIAAARAELAGGSEFDEFRARLDYNQALIELELGDDERCYESVRRAQEGADGADLLLARCADLDARRLLYLDQPSEALPLAREACEVAARVGSAELSRIAGATYATALLRNKRTADALTAARSAARYKRSHFVAEALAVQGVAAFRIDETGDRARAAFAEAIHHADELRAQAWNNYRAWEAIAIARVGLALIDEDTESLDAEIAYGQAIELSANCSGGRHRRMELFDLLTTERPAGTLRRIRTLLT